jgi:hypothetical protein
MIAVLQSKRLWPDTPGATHSGHRQQIAVGQVGSLGEFDSQLESDGRNKLETRFDMDAGRVVALTRYTSRAARRMQLLATVASAVVPEAQRRLCFMLRNLLSRASVGPRSRDRGLPKRGLWWQSVWNSPFSPQGLTDSGSSASDAASNSRPQNASTICSRSIVVITALCSRARKFRASSASGSFHRGKMALQPSRASEVSRQARTSARQRSPKAICITEGDSR